MAQLAAKELNCTYIDTGAMYRAVAWKTLQTKKPVTDELIADVVKDIQVELSYIDGKTQVKVDGTDVTGEIRTPEVTAIVSQVAALGSVRVKMVELQRQMASQSNVLMDGRDIATSVLPNANVKIFLTASIEERARRRFKEMQAKGYDVKLEELQKGNDSDVKPNVMLDFLVPIMILVATAIWTYIAKGGVKILECFIITVIYMSIELSIRKVFKSVTDLVSTAVQGMKSVMSATLILALAYCINTITKSMGAADFLLGVCESWMTPALFLSVTFIAGAVISFFTGSSWGTFAICIPIAVPMAYSFTGGQLGTLVYAAVGAVVSGGLFGDHCSPVSDTSVLSSLGAACDHIDHVRTQLPYALLAAAVSIILWVVVALVGGAA